MSPYRVAAWICFGVSLALLGVAFFQPAFLFGGNPKIPVAIAAVLIALASLFISIDSGRRDAEQKERIERLEGEVVKSRSEIKEVKEQLRATRERPQSSRETPPGMPEGPPVAQDVQASTMLYAQFLYLRQQGVSDPDLDLYIGVLAGDLEQVKRAIAHGADANITDTVLIGRHRDKLEGRNRPTT
jgi:uncharacterized coiled-coil protein SlyX